MGEGTVGPGTSKTIATGDGALRCWSRRRCIIMRLGYLGYMTRCKPDGVSWTYRSHVPLGLRTAGLTCALMQSLSLQSLPFSQGSLLRTTPLSAVATGDGCEYRQRGFVHLRPNLHNVGDWGRSGAMNPGRIDPTDEESAMAVGATDTEGPEVDANGSAGG